MLTTSPSHPLTQFPNLDRLTLELDHLASLDRQSLGLPLVAVGGQLSQDFPLAGTLKATPYLQQSPSVEELLRGLGVTLGRVKLLRLSPNQVITQSVCPHYHSYRYGSLLVGLSVGEIARVEASGNSLRLNGFMGLSLEAGAPYQITGTHGGWLLWVEVPGLEPLPTWVGGDIPRSSTLDCLPILTQSFWVLTPSELASLLGDLERELDTVLAGDDRLAFQGVLDAFKDRWAATFEQFGHDRRGELAYQDLVQHFKETIVAKANRWIDLAGAGQRSLRIIGSMLLTSENTGLRQFSRQVMAKRQQPQGFDWATVDSTDIPQFPQPVFIVSAPRAGSTLLFETLCRFQEFWSIGKESHDVIEGIPELHPQAHHYQSNVLTDTIASETIVNTLKKRWVAQLRNHQNLFYLQLEKNLRPPSLRLLEKTPKNALRIPFLKAMFPDARFIYLYRDPRENINSMIEGWRSRRFVSYQNLPEWPYKDWSFLLVPGWETLKNSSLAEVVAHQWTAANQAILDNLTALPTQQWQFIDYGDLIRHPQTVIREITKFAGLKPDETIEQSLATALPVSCMTLSAPSPDKWRKHEDEINPVLPITQTIQSIVEELRWLPA